MLPMVAQLMSAVTMKAPLINTQLLNTKAPFINVYRLNACLCLYICVCVCVHVCVHVCVYKCVCVHIYTVHV